MKELEIKKVKTHPFEIEELACIILGLDYDEIDADTQIIEQKLFDKFNICLDEFQEIINRLLPLIDIGKSPITNKKYKGFAKDNCWLVKMNIQ